MATAESRLSLVRGRALSARAFERTALVTLGLLWLVVVTGGLVRLTASGLGCPHWPTCEANSLVPSAGYHSVVEFSNRVISGIAMVAALVTAWVGFRVPGLRRSVAWAALAAALGTVAQVPLGAVTVAFDLHPLLVMSHFRPRPGSASTRLRSRAAGGPVMRPGAGRRCWPGRPCWPVCCW